ncbi:MAG: hypothetical protein IPL35_02455 [Sphingobacteriales bacterium]|nr:hypothetical protein [Sphingobacteriales bacterium]
MANKTSQHILGTSANLLGFCLIVITSFHLADKKENSLIDELTSLIALLLTISSMLSFISIRTENKIKEEKLERYADYLFLFSLIGIFGIILFVLIHFLSS